MRALLVLFLFTFTLNAHAQSQIDEHIADMDKRTGVPFDAFTAEDSLGNKVQVKAGMAKVMYVHYWSVTCRPCISSMPEHNDLAKRMDTVSGVLFVNVCVDRPADRKQWLKLLGTLKPKGLNVFVEEGEPAVAIAGQEGYPYYAMVGPDGKLLGHLLDPDFKIYTAYALLRGRDGQSIKGSFNETFKAAGLLEDPANIDAVKRDYPVLFQVKRMYGVE